MEYKGAGSSWLHNVLQPFRIIDSPSEWDQP